MRFLGFRFSCQLILVSDLTLETNIDYGFEPGSGDCMLHDMGFHCWRVMCLYDPSIPPNTIDPKLYILIFLKP